MDGNRLSVVAPKAVVEVADSFPFSIEPSVVPSMSLNMILADLAFLAVERIGGSTIHVGFDQVRYLVAFDESESVPGEFFFRVVRVFRG